MPKITLNTDQDYPVESPESLNGAVRDYLALTEEMQALQADLAEKIAPIKERFHALIDRRSAKQLQISEAAIEYARGHKRELPIEGQTLHLASGDIEYRAGRETLKLTKPEEEVMAELRRAGFGDLIREKYSVDKSAAKKHREALEAGIGLELYTNPETITIKPRKAA